jgi:hypothetical protein
VRERFLHRRRIRHDAKDEGEVDEAEGIAGESRLGRAAGMLKGVIERRLRTREVDPP